MWLRFWLSPRLPELGLSPVPAEVNDTPTTKLLRSLSDHDVL